MKNLRDEISMMYLSANDRDEADLLATGLANASGDKRHVVSIEVMETDKLFKSVFGTIVFIAILCIIAAMNTGCTATVKVHPIYLSDSDQDWEPIGYGMTRDIEVEDEAKK